MATMEDDQEDLDALIEIVYSVCEIIYQLSSYDNVAKLVSERTHRLYLKRLEIGTGDGTIA